MNKKSIMPRLTFTLFTTMIFILSACNASSPVASQAVTEVTSATLISTTEPQKTLVVCLGEEPESLYIYNDSSTAMWSVLEAIYDGPIDTVNFEPEPVILKSLPTIDDGSITLQTIRVTQGDAVANTEGDVVALEKGVKVFADGCTSSDCVTEWDGVSPLNLTQMVVKFSLLENITWSDGQPLTAADSVFSFNISADPDSDVSKMNINRTLSYIELDESTVEWTGRPGYLTQNPSAFFWTPLPQHILGELTAAQMKTDDRTTKNPIGWGAFKIDEWIAGDHIRLVRNPSYFRSGEGLPYYDVVIYRFINAIPEADLSPVLTGECDIIDSSVALETQIKSIRELEIAGSLKAYFGMGPEWEGLNFGIKPSSYDDVYNPYLDRQDFFSDIKVRQAFAYCIDREKIASDVLLSQSTVPDSYLPPTHPYAAIDLASYPHDPDLGNQLLEEAGWVDSDNNPSTPRIADNVANVTWGTEFTINYYLTESTLHANVSKVVVDSLAECGIKAVRSYLSVEEMYSAGSDSLIFGRNFDLAEIAWSTGRQPPCFLYSSSEIPTLENSWLGTRYGGVNFTGYSNEEYDMVCASSLSSGLDHEAFSSANQRIQEILSDELPVLPLFYHVKVVVSRPDLLGMEFDVSSRSALRAIEGISLSAPADTSEQ